MGYYVAIKVGQDSLSKNTTIGCLARPRRGVGMTGFIGFGRQIETIKLDSPALINGVALTQIFVDAQTEKAGHKVDLLISSLINCL